MKYERPEPVWRLLESNSLSRLMADGKQSPAAIRITNADGVSNAPLVGVTDTILERARQEDGLRLTASGYLALKEVAALFEAIPWEEAEKDCIRHVCRVIHERDFVALYMARLILQKAGLLVRRKDRLICRKGTRAAEAHYSEIVTSTFWRMDLSGNDGVPLPRWPQDHIGITLWALSACGSQWSKPSRLIALTTLSHPSLERVAPEMMLSAFGLRVLRPLVWLGLLETEQPNEFVNDTMRVRKSPLFDRTFAFDVALRDRPAGQVH